jgi:hypothetical protein
MYGADVYVDFGIVAARIATEITRTLTYAAAGSRDTRHVVPLEELIDVWINAMFTGDDAPNVSHEILPIRIPRFLGHWASIYGKRRDHIQIALTDISTAIQTP